MIHTETFVVSCLLAFILGMIAGTMYNQWFEKENRRDELWEKPTRKKTLKHGK